MRNSASFIRWALSGLAFAMAVGLAVATAAMMADNVETRRSIHRVQLQIDALEATLESEKVLWRRAAPQHLLGLESCLERVDLQLHAMNRTPRFDVVRHHRGRCDRETDGHRKGEAGQRPPYEARRIPHRSRALRARGLRATSAASAVIGRRNGRSMFSRMNCLTMRSSFEWNAITTNRPPTASRSRQACSPCRSAPISSLTAIRIAWNVRVAAWMRPRRAGGGKARTTRSASWPVRSIR